MTFCQLLQNNIIWKLSLTNMDIIKKRKKERRREWERERERERERGRMDERREETKEIGYLYWQIIEHGKQE